jgi:hypothetical protein
MVLGYAWAGSKLWWPAPLFSFYLSIFWFEIPYEFKYVCNDLECISSAKIYQKWIPSRDLNYKIIKYIGIVVF